ncbi:MFS transporter [Streptomyces luomodiensis]|uniref:MFS transporter n=1 Tax=Streptomyces luomodiensis TaxID=3026192 RepID=A0ABY9VA61_9ACTN|nr:MFS transporter [Streptomyces sp. SCA4-21]WNF01138.1 MFS transporter [Streptomyces sp. SCA4-21]
MATTPSKGTHLRRVATSSYLGTTIEYYDFLLYATAAALVFNEVFFSGLSPWVGTIVALATLAVGYIARFAGAIVFGHFGDRLGRKAVLVTTMVIMGVTSGLIGLMPGSDQIGDAAPLLLVVLRILQGLAVGGEYGGAVLMTSEHADTKRRGLASSAAAMGAASGAVLATGAMTLVTLLPEDQLLAWGWRIPFLVSFLLVGVGLYFRLRIAESPVFLARREEHQPAGAPIVTLLRTHPVTVLMSTGFLLGATVGQGVFGIFIMSYAPAIGYAHSTTLSAVLVSTLIALVATPLFARLSDRIGRRPVVVGGTILMAALAHPAFLLINSGSAGLFMLAVAAVLVLAMTPVVAVAPVMLSELFPTQIRYTGVSTCYQLAHLMAGFTPLIAASLLAAAGGGTNTGLISAFVLVISLLSTLAVWWIPETRTRDLTDLTVDQPRSEHPETVPSA